MSLLESVLRHAPIVCCIDAHLAPMDAHALRHAVPPRCFAACARRPVVDVARFVRRGLWYVYGSAAQDLWPLVENGTLTPIDRFVTWCLNGHPDDQQGLREVLFHVANPDYTIDEIFRRGLLDPVKYLIECRVHKESDIDCYHTIIRGIDTHFHGKTYIRISFSFANSVRMTWFEFLHLIGSSKNGATKKQKK